MFEKGNRGNTIHGILLLHYFHLQHSTLLKFHL